MRIKRLSGFRILVGAAWLMGCSTSPVGHYVLDLGETKLAVDEVAKAHPDVAATKGEVIKMLEQTSVDLILDEAGKMSSTAELKQDGQVKTNKVEGSWKQDAKRVTITVPGDPVTTCDVDGKRLRCVNESLPTLFTRYVMRRK